MNTSASLRAWLRKDHKIQEWSWVGMGVIYYFLFSEGGTESQRSVIKWQDEARILSQMFALVLQKYMFSSNTNLFNFHSFMSTHTSYRKKALLISLWLYNPCIWHNDILLHLNNFFLFSFGCVMWQTRSKFSWPGIKSMPLHWEHGVLTTGLTVKSQ